LYKETIVSGIKNVLSKAEAVKKARKSEDTDKPAKGFSSIIKKASKA